MRILLTPNLQAKDGQAVKQPRMINLLKEVRSNTSSVVALRPGLVVAAATVGNGNGVVAFNEELVSVYGATLGQWVASDEYSETLITDDIAPDTVPVSVASVANNQWILRASNATDELGYTYVLDTSDNSLTLIDSDDRYEGTQSVSSDGVSVVLTYRNADNPIDPYVKVSATVGGPFTDVSYFDLDPLKAVYGDGRYVVINSSAVAYTSGNILNWAVAYPGSEHYRSAVFDGTTWWIYGWNDANPIYSWCFSTENFSSFTEHVMQGQGATATIGDCVYREGVFYALFNYLTPPYWRLRSSVNGYTWGEAYTACGSLLKTGAEGGVYVTSSDSTSLSSVDPLLNLSPLNNTPFNGVCVDFSSEDSAGPTIILTGAGEVLRLDPAEVAGTISPLSSVEVGRYDFAQSVL